MKIINHFDNQNVVKEYLADRHADAHAVSRHGENSIGIYYIAKEWKYEIDGDFNDSMGQYLMK